MAGTYERIPFPINGLVRRQPYQEQPKLTTPDCLNVRPDDPLLQRDRGGSRPGLKTLFSTALGHPINGITDIEWISSGSPTVTALVMANGVLYRSSGLGYGATLTACANQTPTLRTDITLTAANCLQKTYIAGDNASNHNICVFNPSADTLVTLASVTTAGTAPIKNRIVTAFRNRICAAWDEVSPHLLYMSAQNDPTNWDYTATGAGAAVTLETSLAGDIAQPIRALCQWKDSRLIVGCVSSLWVLEGDPLYGGRVNRLSERVGIVDKLAWTFLPDGSLLFLSWDGLYVLSEGVVTAISRDVLPQELYAQMLNTANYTISMTYDIWHRGVQIYCIPTTASSAATFAWWVTFHGERPAFWPMGFGTTDHEPLALWAMRPNTPSTDTDSLVMLGSRDGYVRLHDRSVAQDDTTDITTYIDIGPIDLAKPGYNGKLNELKLTLGADSGKVEADVRVGNTGEAAFNAAVFASRTFANAGVNTTMRPRARGNRALVKLSGADSGPSTSWAVEEMLATIEPGGKVRVAS